MAIVHSKDKAEKNRLTLKDIFSMPDDLGLLKVKAINSSSAKDLNAARFEEINQFIDKNRRPPLNDASHLNEKQLARRLQSILTNKQSMSALKSLDRHMLFKETSLQLSHKDNEPMMVSVVAENATSLDDIFNSDELGLLNIEASDIFDIKHVPVIEREMPDEIAQRTHCKDFYEFASTFKRHHANIENKSVEIVTFKSGSQIDEADVFILRGMLCLVDKIEISNETGERFNPRLRVIFENGTESNLLLRSLAAALYKDENGRRILKPALDIEKSFQGISHKDKRSGVVYIVTSLSNNPTLRAVPNLFKIGYTESTVEERTKNALRDTAFLESPIQIVASIECFNLNPQRFESLIHGFLSAQRLNIELTSHNGQTYRPREWFSVPLETAREVVKRIIDGTIIQYRINNTTGQLIHKKTQQ